MRLLAITIILSLLSACAPKSEAPSPEVPKDGTLTGEAFIVTQGGQNIKLGLVPVRVIPESVAREFLAMKEAATSELAKSLEPKMYEQRIKRDAAKLLRDEVMDRWAEASADVELGPALDNFAEVFGAQSVRKGWTAQDVRKLKKKLDELEAERLQCDEALKMLEAEANGTRPKPSYFFFDGLPAGIAEAKTNADGAFSVTIPREGKFMLAATGSRNVMSDSETYYWLIWVSLDGAAEKHIMLANDNLTTSGSPESIITALR